MMLRGILNPEAISIAILPTAANLAFNMLNVVFDSVSKHIVPEPAASTFDTSVGCVFAMIGVYVAIKNDNDARNKVLFIFSGLIIMIIGADSAGSIYKINPYIPVFFCDIASFIGLMWSVAADRGP